MAAGKHTVHEDGPPILHVMTVGISMFEKTSPSSKSVWHEDEKSIRFAGANLITTYGRAKSNISLTKDGNYRDMLQALTNLDPAEQVARRAPGCNKVDFLPAEISYLQIFYADSDPPSDGDGKDKVILLASDTALGQVAAMLLQDYLKAKCPPSPCRPAASSAKWIDPCVEICKIDGLQHEKPSVFQVQGVQNLAKQINQIVKKYAQSHQIIVNITGGFKGQIPHVAMVASSYEGVRVNYLFEQSQEIIELPAIPVTFDLMTWRDHRGIVEVLAKGDQNYGLVHGLPPSMQALFSNDNGKARANVLYQSIKSRYDRDPSSLSEYGPGGALVDRINDDTMRELVQNHIPIWRHAWLGDQVPEMAEHQRGHAQRALELATQILVPMYEAGEGPFSPHELAVFLGGLWLHDIGHAGKYFTWNDTDYFVDGFPPFVREYHHLLTAQMLQDDIGATQNGTDGAYFKNGTPKEFIEAVRLVALYHRDMMPLSAKDSGEISLPDGKKNALPTNLPCEVPGPDECIKVDDKDIRWQNITALYRVIDASDCQEGRAGRVEYREARRGTELRNIQALLDRARYLLTQCSPLNSNYKCVVDGAEDAAEHYGEKSCEDERKTIDDSVMKKLNSFMDGKYSGGSVDICEEELLSALCKVMFKLRQPDHINKHLAVSTVYYTCNKNGGTWEITPHIIYDPCKGTGSPQGAVNDIKGELSDPVQKLLKDLDIQVMTPEQEELQM